MKKLFSLLLALCCVLALTPVIAEETSTEVIEMPPLQLPMTLEAYQQGYEAVIALIAPDATITWTDSTSDDVEAKMAIINDSFIGVIVLPVDGMVSELAVLVQSTLDEDTLTSFLSMSACAGAPLLISEEIDAEAAVNAFVSEIYTVFITVASGDTADDIYTLPGTITISDAGDGSYQYYFALKPMY